MTVNVDVDDRRPAAHGTDPDGDRRRTSRTGTWKPPAAPQQSSSTRRQLHVRRRSASRRVDAPDLTPDVPYSTTSRGGLHPAQAQRRLRHRHLPRRPGRRGSPSRARTTRRPRRCCRCCSSLTLDYSRRAAARPERAVRGRRPVLPRRLRSVTPSSRSRPTGRACRCCPSSAPGPTRPKASSTSGCATCTRRRTSRCCSRSSTAPPTRSSVKPEQPHPLDLPARQRVGAVRRRRRRRRHRRAARLRDRDARRPRRRDHRPHACCPPGCTGSGSPWPRRATPCAACVAVAAQALRATYVVPRRRRRRRAPSSCPPGTITKLDQPGRRGQGRSSQPFPTFGGRPVETTAGVRHPGQRAAAAQGPGDRAVGLRAPDPRGVPRRSTRRAA